jgi:antitoxin component YwqK of YwqJK toxin-antitoxin module
MKRFLVAILCFCLFEVENFSQDTITNGYKKIYYPNGSLQSEGNLVNGTPEGFWINYYPTGVKKSEGRRKYFQLDSTWVFYSITGDTLQKINYLGGKKNGFSYEYFLPSATVKAGRVKDKELYVNNQKEGLCYYYYDNGKINRKIYFEKNVPEGYAYEYDTDGRLITIEKYRKGTLLEKEKVNRFDDSGNKIGIWQEFYEDGKLRNESNYKNGSLEGYHKEYDQNGALKLTLLYQEGKLISNVDDVQSKAVEKTENYSDGKPKHIGSYVNDKPVGIHKEYKTDGSVEMAYIYNDNSELVSKGVIDDDGKREGPWEEYYGNGKILSKGIYKNNQRTGSWDFFYENGKKEQTGEFQNGKYIGEWKWYYTDGNLWKEEEYLSGLRDGHYTEFDEGGNIIVEGEFVEGERDGDWTTIINDNKAVGKYVNGLMDGKWKYFYDNGNVLFEGNFIQGNPDGKQKYYFPDGNLKEEQYYNQGIKENNWKKYNDAGELILTVTYKQDKEYRINGTKVGLSDNSPTVIK